MVFLACMDDASLRVYSEQILHFLTDSSEPTINWCVNNMYTDLLMLLYFFIYHQKVSGMGI